MKNKKIGIFGTLAAFFLTVIIIVISHIINNIAADFKTGILKRTTDDPSVLYDCNGTVIATFSTGQIRQIYFSQIPKHVWQAFLAVEDRTFFTHNGISYKGIIRSIFINLKSRKKTQGASTITQQLARLLFLDAHKTFKRKMTEVIYTFILENHFSKEQILEAYLNNVYFGAGIYGIESAAQEFWGISTEQLSIAQAASLAAIVRHPRYYCPLINPENTLTRRNIVLKAMFDCGYITDTEYKTSIAQELNVKPKHREDSYLYIKEMVRAFCKKQGFKDLYHNGYQIRTTIKSETQKNAYTIFKKHCYSLRDQLKLPIDGGLLSIKPDTGQIQALIGGYDFHISQFNRAWNTKRQIGSTLKPFIFAAALIDGKKFEDTEIDEPIELTINNKIWAPQNYNKKHDGRMTRAYALARSNNIIAIKTMLSTNKKTLLNTINALELGHFESIQPSIALGCIDSSLKDVARMFNIFANQGTMVEPYFIEWIKNSRGEKIYQSTISKKNILPFVITSKVNAVLSYAFKYVYKLQEWKDGIGKTGTTNDCRTCWFVGSTPELTTAIYIGCDNNQPMGTNVYPIKTVVPIWKEFYQTLPAQKTAALFSYAHTLKKCCIDVKTGKIVPENNSKTIMLLL